MIKIENNNIYLTKGDTATINVGIYYEDGTPYEWHTGDKLLFSMKANNNFNNAVIEKTLTTPVIEFTPSDTNVLSFETFNYSITLIYANGARDTFLVGDFIIAEQSEVI